MKNFAVKEVLGTGRFGTVVRLHHLDERADFAMKKIPVYSKSQQIYAANEAVTHISLDHRNIVFGIGFWITELKGKMFV